MNLKGKTLFITGASRGIGLAIAKRAAADGANIVVVAKTAEPDPRLPGTIYSAAEEIRAAGGQALPLQVDIRDEAQVREAVERAVVTFGGIDILVNNASAISLTDTEHTPMKRYDLMNGINARGTFLCTQACLPELKKAAAAGRNAHVLTMSPPLSMKTHWFAPHTAYSMAKYGMSLCTLGHAGEFRRYGIGACRKPEILADAAHLILTSDARDERNSGNFHIDDALLAAHGQADLERYSVTPGTTRFVPDFFVD
jgi:citronellol/citronellal dehydrogenase